MNANLIAYDAIGDNFANRLDQITDSMFQQLKSPTHWSSHNCRDQRWIRSINPGMHSLD